MPLVRLGLWNEFGLGNPELYKGASKKEREEEEPKAVLDGIAVAGLVGILRQLGDLADFAATVFHDLHEQVTATRIRGRKMMTRVRNIEAALPSVEKALKDQQIRHTMHFAYAEGCDWRACLQVEQNLLHSSELPRFMMDSYEECRGPPCLYLLDKFDHAGNGACLKRYSDPSYFKRMWAAAASPMENNENLQVDRKLQKIKRKESHKRNRGAQHAGYGSWHDNSSVFASSSVGGQRFFLENVSSPDVKLDISSRSTSFGSKSRVPLVVTAPKLDDEPGADSMDDVSQHDFLHEESIPRSSSITWDEKIEIVKSPSPASYDDIHVDRVQDSQDVIRDQDSQSQPVEVDSEPEVTDHDKIEVSDGARILLNIGKVSGPLSGANHFDEVISEADNYVDALNTLDSETETEAECCTKREMKSLPSFRSQGTEPRTGAVPAGTVQNSNFYAAEEAEGLAVRLSHLSSSDGLEHVQSPHAMGFSQNQEFSAVNGHSENNAHGVSESKDDDDDDCRWSGNSSSTMKVIECTGEVSKMKNPPISDVPGASTIQLWTNGGLFGVEPSKPPEPGVVSTQGKKPVSDSKNFSSDLSSYAVKSQMIANELNVKSDATSLKDKPTSVGFSHELKANGKHNNLSSSAHGNSTNGHLYATGYSAGSEGSAPGNDDHCDSDVKQESQVSPQLLSQSKFDKSPEETSISNSVGDYEVNLTRNSASSSFSELAQRFLASTPQRKAALSTHSGSCIEIGKSEETSPYRSKVVSNGAEFKAYYEEHINEKVAHVSPNSPLSSTSHCPEQSSPPLEYMKISFHPMNGLGNSKLKQGLPGGGPHENSDDSFFPSFQLLPGRRVEPDVCSESDDDTFCRSCPYSSEDIPSPRSYSHSEQWEEDEKSECIDPEINDVEHGFQSSSTPISGSMQQRNHSNMGAPSVLSELDAQNSQVLFQAKSTEDLPGLESVLLGNQQQEKFHSSPKIQPKIEVRPKVELPPPPPLPPVQWTTKSSTTSKGNDANLSSSINHLDRPESVQCSRREERPSPKSPPVVAVISPDSSGKQDKTKLNLKKRPNRSVIHKETDTREDLLHQIRNQPFNLRRTARRAQGDVPQSTNNVADVNVAAILEKASAIRQAFVGSDDGGDDDNWE